jgi:hypothetical protein
VVLRRRGVATRFVPPVSIVLAADSRRYIEGLVGFCEGRIQAWCALFGEACGRAAAASGELAAAIAALQAEWTTRAGRPRRDSAAARIIAALPAQPIASAAAVGGLIGASPQRALDGLKALERAGVVRQVTRGRYDRQYAADELFALLETYEDRIASS